MKINEFKLERYFAKHEFTAKYLLSSSDCDGYALPYLLAQATQNELALWEGMTLGYTESAGNPLLREAIAQYYKIKSIENVVVATPGELDPPANFKSLYSGKFMIPSKKHHVHNRNEWFDD